MRGMANFFNSSRAEFDSSEPLSLDSTQRELLSRPGFDSLEPLSLNSTRQELLSRQEFDSAEPLSLEYEYEIEGLGRPQQQEHCPRFISLPQD